MHRTLATSTVLAAVALIASSCAHEAPPPVWPGPGGETAGETAGQTAGEVGGEQGAAPAAPAADIATAPEGPMDPSLATEKAPPIYRVKLETTKGDVVIEVHRDWSPNGADRLYNLVKLGYFHDVAIFRVISGFMAQFGLHGNPAVNAAWSEASIPDDEAGESNRRGTVSFATAGPNTRTTQLFINYADNLRLDDMGFTPVGKVVSGMENVDAWESVYGEGAPGGRGPSQGRIAADGNAYLKADFPRLDYIRRAALVE